jgi:hypothetical protein
MLQGRQNRDFQWETMADSCLFHNDVEDRVAKLRNLHFTRNVYIILTTNSCYFPK